MKNQFIQQFLTTVTVLSQSMSTAVSLTDTYFDRGYGAGSANEITADDLASTGLTPAQIAAGITLFQQLQALRHGGAVVPGDYDVTLNQLRRDL